MTALLHRILIDPAVPADSYVRTQLVHVPVHHVVIRPYTPAGFTKSGIFVERNSKFPRVWGWLLAMSAELADEMPELLLGSMVGFQRFSDEELGQDAPPTERYIGHKLPVHIVHVDNLHFMIYPPIVKPEY